MVSILSGIYKITNETNGHSYIGQSKDIHRRWANHICDLKAGKHTNYRLQGAFNSVGLDYLTFSIVLLCEPYELCYYENEIFRITSPEYNISSDMSVSKGAIKTYTNITLVSPDGQVFTEITNQSDFFTSRGFKKNTLSLLSDGTHKGVDGWYLIPETYDAEPPYVYNFSDIEDEINNLVA